MLSLSGPDGQYTGLSEPDYNVLRAAGRRAVQLHGCASPDIDKTVLQTSLLQTLAVIQQRLGWKRAGDGVGLSQVWDLFGDESTGTAWLLSEDATGPGRLTVCRHAGLTLQKCAVRFSSMSYCDWPSRGKFSKSDLTDCHTFYLTPLNNLMLSIQQPTKCIPFMLAASMSNVASKFLHCGQGVLHFKGNRSL